MTKPSLKGPGFFLFTATAALAMSSLACPSVVDTTGGSGGDGNGGTGTGNTGGTGTTTTLTDTGPPIIVDKIDIVLAIDNSRSMADKQTILAMAVPDLISSLANPPCVDPASGAVVAVPAGPLDACPAGSQREFNPILDIHIGIISSSLGGHGSDACTTAGTGKASNNDKAHLLARIDPTMAAEVETYQNLKFLAWDPAQKLVPPGEADISTDSAADANGTALLPSLTEMVLGVGQIGCGYEAQLESWYRFLAQPDPPDNITLDAKGKVLLEGVDKVLLDMRKAFLRPDSALVIVMLTDENDCSIRETSQYYFAAQQKTSNGTAFHLPKGRQICETDPANECCFSCGQPGPKDDNGDPLCADDPSCKDASGKTVYLDDLTDNINLRCFHQKQRFGIDFLYETQKYVAALQQKTVTDRNGQVVSNPIFTDLDTTDTNTTVREPQLVLLAGIVGVPWQDIARTNANGVPDLKAGLDEDGKAVGGFKSPAQMAAVLPSLGYDTWGLILGDFAAYGAPKDPLMLESVEARTGSNPVTGDLMATSAQPLANKINGHEYSIPKRDELQYACVFPLVKVDAVGNVAPDVRDCTDLANLVACDCDWPENDSPLCEVNPATGEPTNQVRAKVYPGLRHLAVLKGLGLQGVVASGCPAQMLQPFEPDFGYRPAMASLLARLKPHFN